MRKFNFTLVLSLFAIGMYAQLINDGATITVKNGATLFVESDVTNNANGKIILEGNAILEVQGNLTSTAAGADIQAASGSTVKFSGAAAKSFAINGDSLGKLELAKTAAVNVTMTGNAVVKTDVNFNSASASKLDLGSGTLTLMGTATTTGADSDEYFVTGPAGGAGTGTLRKNYAAGALAASTYTYHVGDATSYSPLASSITGTAAAGATLSVRANDIVQPNRATVLPDATNYLSRFWNVDAVSITPYSNALTGTYINSTVDVASGMVAANIKGSSWSSSAPTTWSFASAGGTPPNVTGTTTTLLSDFTGTDLFTKVNIIANLQGPTVSGGSMTTDLQNYFGGNVGLLPATSPYGAPTSTYSNINNPTGAVGAVTDWVKVQVRSAATPGTVLSTKSLLLKPNGTIVNVENGSPLLKGAGSVHLVVQHRNHQAVMSNAVTLNGTDVNYDFTTALTQAFNAGGDPAQLVLKNTKWCIPAGDVNTDLSVDGIDLSQTLSAFNAGLFDTYLSTDVNLDGVVDGIDLSTVRAAFNIGYYSSLINY